MTLDAVLARIARTLPEAVGRLMGLPRIPLISTDPAFGPRSDRAGDRLVADLARSAA